MAVVVVPLQILDEQGLPRYRQLRTELEQVKERNVELDRRAGALMRQVERLRNDPNAIESVARDELGMVRDGELVFQFPRESTEIR